MTRNRYQSSPAELKIGCGRKRKETDRGKQAVAEKGTKQTEENRPKGRVVDKPTDKRSGERGGENMFPARDERGKDQEKQ